MAQKGKGGNQVGTGIGVVEGELSDSHFSGTEDLNLRISSIFQGELIKKLQVPLQVENVNLSPLVSILQKSKGRLKVELWFAKGT